MPKLKTSKSEVLQKVIPTIRKKGIANSSMSQLAMACGIQKSHFYYYFDNKEDLIKDVLATVNSYMKYNFDKIVTDDTISLKQKVALVDALIFKLFLQHEGGCVMANAALESAHEKPVYFKEIKYFFEGFIHNISLLLGERYKAGKAKSIAEQIVQDIEGGILLMRIFKDKKYLQNAVKRMSQHILD